MVRLRLAALTSLLAVVALAGCFGGRTPSRGPVAVTAASVAEADPAQVAQMCGSCHATPPPDTFPRAQWPRLVHQGFGFFHSAGMTSQTPALASVLKYYQDHAPESLPVLHVTDEAGPTPVRFQRLGFREPGPGYRAGIGSVTLVHLTSPTKLDVLACDVTTGDLLLLRPYLPHAHFQKLATLLHPAHAEVTDLDGDGIPDIVVADLGLFVAADVHLGRILWLRGSKDGTFTPHVLMNALGRTADVQVADFDGDGRKDLVVGEFGHHELGSVQVLMNRTTDWAHPVFEPHVLEQVTGTIHVPVCRLQLGDRPDIVALQSQEHEKVVAYVNKGGGRFEKNTLFAGPHPDFNSSGIEMADFNGDGRPDVIYTNGDLYDEDSVLRADQGVQWLENKGGLHFVRHPLAQMYGSYHAVAADAERSGRQDVFAVSDVVPGRLAKSTADFDSVIFLSQGAGGQFRRYALERGTCDHFSCAVGDIFGDGRMDLVTSSFIWRGSPTHCDGVTIFRNLGAAKSSPQRLAARP